MSEPISGNPRDRYEGFPTWFFSRVDESVDSAFYDVARLVTHIDEGAVTEVSRLYDELGLADGAVLDLCSSWISHFAHRPQKLVALGMNEAELARNGQAHSYVVMDLNERPVLPFEDESFDAATCCVSVDYLTRPIEVFEEVARVLRPGGMFCLTFSNRCFPTKAIRGWLQTEDQAHCALVADYFRRSQGTKTWGEPIAQLRNPGARADPLYGVWASRA